MFKFDILETETCQKDLTERIKKNQLTEGLEKKVSHLPINKPR